MYFILYNNLEQQVIALITSLVTIQKPSERYIVYILERVYHESHVRAKFRSPGGMYNTPLANTPPFMLSSSIFENGGRQYEDINSKSITKKHNGIDRIGICRPEHSPVICPGRQRNGRAEQAAHHGRHWPGWSRHAQFAEFPDV